MAERFQADGYDGELTIESTGTGGGFNAFCAAGGEYDIIDASRAVDAIEFEACKANGRELTEYRIGTDAVVAVVSSANDFATDISRAQLEQLFTEAVLWSDIDPEWPAQEIKRFIPTAESGTMDFFVQSFFDEQTLEEMSYDGLVNTFIASVSTGRCRAVEREQKFYANYLVCDDPGFLSGGMCGR